MSEQSSEDLDLAFTQSVRRKLVAELTKDGKMPTESREQLTLLSALSDMDRQSLGVKKINSDEGLGNKQLAAAATLAQLFNNPQMKTLGRATPGETLTLKIPVLDESVKPSNLIEGELEIITSGESYESFTQRMGMTS